MACTIAGKTVGRIGLGMIGLTFPGKHPSTDDAIDTLKAALDMGANFWNAGELYGTPDYNSLHLLKAYFERYPEDVDKVVVSLKSCFDMRGRKALVDAENVRKHIENCLAIVDGKYRIDLFQAARLDPDVPVEETVGAIAEYVRAGKIGSVGLSECSGASIRKAVEVTPIAAVEVELSVFETGIYRNGVAEACGEFNIPIAAYSPLNRGFLTGQWRRYADMADEDFRKKMFPRFAKEVFDDNMKLVHEMEKAAQAKGCTTVQAAIAWVCAQTERVGATVIPIPGASSVNRVNENMKDVRLSEEEMKQIDEALQSIEVRGARVPAGFEHFMEV